MSDLQIQKGRNILHMDTEPIGPFLDNFVPICIPSDVATPGCRMLDINNTDASDIPKIRVGDAKERTAEFLQSFVYTSATEFLSSEYPPGTENNGFLDLDLKKKMRLFASMSLLAYHVKLPTDIPTAANLKIVHAHDFFLYDNGWREAKHCEGYLAYDPLFEDTDIYTVYYNPNEGPGHFVVAFRGTTLVNPADVARTSTSIFKRSVKASYDDMRTNFSTYFNAEEGNEQYDRAFDFIAKFRTRYVYKKLTLTGHSKGGSLAYHVAQKTNLPCVLFNPFLRYPKSSWNNSPPVLIFRMMYDIASLFYSLFQTGPNDQVVVVDGYRDFSQGAVGGMSPTGLLRAHEIASFIDLPAFPKGPDAAFLQWHSEQDWSTETDSSHKWSDYELEAHKELLQ